MFNPSWLPVNIFAPAAPQTTNNHLDRSPAHLSAVTRQFFGPGPDEEAAERYLPRDVTNDDVDDTFCNVFIRDWSVAMGAPIPFLLANQMHAWLLSGEGRLTGWIEVSRDLANRLAALGLPVVASRVGVKHGHIAAVMPPVWPQPTIESALQMAQPGRPLYVAQAGRRVFLHEPVEHGFGRLIPTFVAHI